MEILTLSPNHCDNPSEENRKKFSIHFVKSIPFCLSPFNSPGILTANTVRIHHE